jgi:Zn-dependent protease with chaperone function
MCAERRRILGGGAPALAALWLGAGLLAGCETMPQSIASLPVISQLRPSGPANPLAELPPPVARTWPDVRQDVINQRARGFGLVNAPELQRYLNGLLARIKAAAGVPTWPGGVHVLASHALDAYATAAGNIYVSLSWLTDMESEDELVALLSHEFAHIYLHYHQLESAVADADTVTSLLGLGVGLTLKAGEANRWNKVDTLLTTYSLGRGLVTTIYSQSEESAADRFSLSLTHKLGYSYDHGIKAFLERLASWEDEQEKREKQQQEALLAAIRAQAATAPPARPNAPAGVALPPGLNESSGVLQGELNAAVSQLGFDLSKGFEKVAGSHPSTLKRLDAMAETAAAFPAIAEDREAKVKPLQAARQERRTAGVLENYGLAFKVIDAPAAPGALELARKALAGPTAAHAVPLFAQYVATNEQPPAPRAPRVADPSLLLEPNFAADADRAWVTYKERVSRLKDARQVPAAQRVLDQGLSHFSRAEEAMPYAVRFYGETKGWEEAKRRAQACAKDFPRLAQRCNQAAMSPAEQKQQAAKDKAKQGGLFDRFFK